MHKVHVFDQWASQGAGDSVSPPVGDESSPDLIFNLLTEMLDASLHLLTQKAPVELGEILILHESLDKPILELLEIQSTKGPVQVIGAAHRSPRLHPGQLVHRGPRPAADAGLVETGQCLEQRVEQLIEVERRRLDVGTRI
jgi:hypothetical protein